MTCGGFKTIAHGIRKLEVGVLSDDEKLAAKLRYEDGCNVARVAQHMSVTQRRAVELLDSVLRKLNLAKRSKGRCELRRAARKAGVR